MNTTPPTDPDNILRRLISVAEVNNTRDDVNKDWFNLDPVQIDTLLEGIASMATTIIRLESELELLKSAQKPDDVKTP
jgi:hypothetical protein